MSCSIRSRLGLPGIPNGVERFVGDGERVRSPVDDILRDLLGLIGEGGTLKASGYSNVRFRPVEGVTGVEYSISYPESISSRDTLGSISA